MARLNRGSVLPQEIETSNGERALPTLPQAASERLAAATAEAFVFGCFCLDVERWELRRGGALVHLEPAAFKLLVYLVQHRDRVVPKCELLEVLWPEQFVSEGVLPQCVFVVRHALDDDGQAQRMLRTYRGRGYRFVADVEPVPNDRFARHADPSAAARPLSSHSPAGVCRSCGSARRRRSLEVDVAQGSTLGPDSAALPSWLETLLREIRDRLSTGAITPEELTERLRGPAGRRRREHNG